MAKKRKRQAFLSAVEQARLDAHTMIAELELGVARQQAEKELAGLAELGIRELKQRCQTERVKGYSSLRKGELVEAITSAHAARLARPIPPIDDQLLCELVARNKVPVPDGARNLRQLMRWLGVESKLVKRQCSERVHVHTDEDGVEHKHATPRYMNVRVPA